MRKLFLTVTTLCVTMGLAGFAVAFMLVYQPYESPDTEVLAIGDDQPVIATDDDELVTDATVIVYRYIYEDGSVSATEATAPHFLIGYSREDVENHFANWQVDSFSTNRVVVSREAEEDEPTSFIIGEHEGRVAVFYVTQTGVVLKEITDTPLSALTAEDRDKLENGIHVEGYNQMLQHLEDFGS